MRHLIHYSRLILMGCLMACFIAHNAHAIEVVTVMPDEIHAIASQSYQRAQSMMPELMEALHQKATPMVAKKIHAPMVFVSLGMPDLLLTQILKASREHHVSVVIRGLYQDNFEATLKRIQSVMPKDLNGEIQSSGVLINPLWFRDYAIDTVPALVVPYGESGDYDVVFGNVNLSEALDIVQRHRQGERV